MDAERFDTVTRTVFATGTRRGLLRLLASLAPVSSLALLLDKGDTARADGSVAGVRGGNRRRHRRQTRHRHDPGDKKDKRTAKRVKARCALCRAGESCTKGMCSCGGGPGCTGAGEICQSGICHNPYGCSDAMDFCRTDPMNPTFTSCPGNSNGVCITAAEGQFCIVIGNPVGPNSECAPDNTCASCPAGTDCLTLLGGMCTCPGNKGCAVIPPPP